MNKKQSETHGTTQGNLLEKTLIRSNTSTGTHAVPLKQNSLDCQDPRSEILLMLGGILADPRIAAGEPRVSSKSRSVGMSAQNMKSLRLRVFGMNLESHHFKTPNR